MNYELLRLMLDKQVEVEFIGGEAETVKLVYVDKTSFAITRKNNTLTYSMLECLASITLECSAELNNAIEAFNQEPVPNKLEK